MQRERKHIRLTDWDYSSEGVYFLTICCHDRKSFFGNIINNEMILSEIGLVARQLWYEIPQHFQHVKLDEFIIMPNHIHGIIILDYSLVGSRHGVTLQHPQNHHIVRPRHGMAHNTNQFSHPVKNSVSVIINQYKSSVKRWCNKNGFIDFQWQSRFYDRILRNEEAMKTVRDYIFHNPGNWQNDDLYV